MENARPKNVSSLYRRPLEIPELFVTESLRKALHKNSRSYTGTRYVEPADASSVLEETEDSFPARRLKTLWLDEMVRRFTAARSPKTQQFVGMILETIKDAEIGSHGSTSDEPFDFDQDDS